MLPLWIGNHFDLIISIVTSPKMVAASYPALSLLGFSPETDIHDLKFIEYFAGNRIHSQSNPAAHCYCGYQFGSFSGQLGDGAAMSLGEIVNPQTNERWELQLKGAGPTPYSRQSDGRKVLRSSIREFLASEAMHGLGFPFRPRFLIASRHSHHQGCHSHHLRLSCSPRSLLHGLHCQRKVLCHLQNCFQLLSVWFI
jgi:uncharacterized protein YdiU (UPF0061 family)